VILHEPWRLCCWLGPCHIVANRTSLFPLLDVMARVPRVTPTGAPVVATHDALLDTTGPV